MMALIPYEPFRYMDNIRREMDRFFGFPWGADFHGPRVDVYETDQEVIAQCEIPGLESKDDINIEIRENMLELRGTIKRSRETKEEHFHRQERFTGAFHRSITLPAPVVTDDTRAEYRNGILEITMPKAEPQRQRRRIEVNFH
jgi:HSP20 family protein